MSTPSSITTEYRPKAIKTAVERVVAYGRSLIANAPEQLLDIVERQARQVLKQQSVIQAREQQLKTLEKEVAALKAEQRIGSVAPFRIDEKKREFTGLDNSIRRFKALSRVLPWSSLTVSDTTHISLSGRKYHPWRPFELRNNIYDRYVVRYLNGICPATVLF